MTAAAGALHGAPAEAATRATDDRTAQRRPLETMLPDFGEPTVQPFPQALHETRAAAAGLDALVVYGDREPVIASLDRPEADPNSQ